MVRPGRITYTWSASIAMLSSTCRTGIFVCRARMSATMLSRSGGRC